MALFERRVQVAELDRLLVDCRGGRGHVALVDGPATTGRSALLREIGLRAADLGVLQLRASCADAEHTLAFGVMTQLVGGLPSELRAETTRLLFAATDPDEAVRLCHFLSSALITLAEQQPLLITVDDVRHADELSVRCLLHLVRRLESIPALLVFSDQPGAGGELRAEIVRQPHFTHVQVGPLSPAGVRALAGDVPDLFALSGGNPLVAIALADDYRREGKPCVTGYGEAVLSGVRRAGDVHLKVARALAVLGADATPADVATLSDVDSEAAAYVRTQLTAAGLLHDGWFRHQAAASAVLRDLHADDRAELHNRAALLGHDRGLPAEVVAEHLVRAEQTSGEWVAEILLEAARHELSRNGTATALRYLTRARQACPAGPIGAAIEVLLVQTEWQTSPASAIRHLESLVQVSRDGHLSHRDAVTVVRTLLWFNRVDQATEALEKLRTEHSAELRDAEVWLSVNFPALHRPPTEGGRDWIGTDPWLGSTAALATLLSRGRTDDIGVRVDQALNSLHLHQNTPWGEESALLGLHALLFADRVAEAATWCDRLAESCDGWGPWWRGMIAAVRAEIAIRGCDLRAAVTNAEAALAELPERAWGVAVGLPLGSLILAHTRLGDREAAAKWAARPVPEAMTRSRYGLHYLYARGHHHLATDSPQAALADFMACGELMREWNLDLGGLVPWRAYAAEALLRQGKREQAERLVGDELNRQGSARTRVRGMCLRLLAAIKPIERRMGLLTEAADILEGCGDQHELARVLAALGRTHRLLGDHRRARVAVQRAWHLANVDRADVRDNGVFPEFGNLSTSMVQPRRTPESVPAGVDEGVELLTECERRVATLAAMGYTNREIAMKLFITGSTVEQHLTRVYRKLKVRQRKELPASLRSDMVRTA